jgi:hypothetical protein
MDEELHAALKEAMTPPWAWTHRASLSPTQVLARLGELGYVVVRADDARATAPVGTGRALTAVASRPGLTSLMRDLDARVAAARDDAAREAATESAAGSA